MPDSNALNTTLTKWEHMFYPSKDFYYSDKVPIVNEVVKDLFESKIML